MERENILYKGKKIFFRKEGKGDAVVLLHGFTESMDIWIDFAAELSRAYTIITPDLPGHGGSECLGEIHTMEEMAQCVNFILEMTGISTCTMIGHSMGGYVALAFAEMFPQKIKGLGLFHSSALADSEEAKTNRDRAIRAIQQNHTNFISSFIPDLFSAPNRERYSTEIKKLVQTASGMTAESIIAAQRGMRERLDRTHVLSGAAYPVLFIAGKLDTRVPFEKVMQQAALPNDAIVLSMGDVAHMGYIEARDKTLYAIRAFLEGIF